MRATAEIAALALREADRLQADGDLKAAAACYRLALAHDGGLVDAWWGLGCAALTQGAAGAAIFAFERAVALDPDCGRYRVNLAKARFELGEIEAALADFCVAAADPDPAVQRRALENIACVIPGSQEANNAAVLQARRAWAALETPARPARRRPVPRHADGKLRIGYVSAFFGERNWMKPVWAVVNEHDRAAFEIHLFCDRALPEAGGGFREQPRDYIHDIGGADNEGLAAYVARAGIDILVDLNGYSFPERLGLFRHRPAPVVVGWFNYYATSGIDAVDYIVGDAAVIPPEEERFYGERVVRVPGTYLAFSVLYPVPAVVAPPCAGGNSLTFGCLGSQYKITDTVIASWAAILAAAPRSRLLLKNRTLADPSNRGVLHARFARHGIGADRLLLEGPAEHYDFLAAYDRVDVALDTFPYNGGTTTAEALWQGVPVLSFAGDRWAGRTSRSLLLAAGLGTWCLPDRAAYVAQAVALAQSPATPAQLAALRATMRERLAVAPICDGAGLARALERLYRRIAVSPRSARSSRNPAP